MKLANCKRCKKRWNPKLSTCISYSEGRCILGCPYCDRTDTQVSLTIKTENIFTFIKKLHRLIEKWNIKNYLESSKAPKA
jgi:hypothetical protein